MIINFNRFAFQSKRIKIKVDFKNKKSIYNWLRYINSDRFHANQLEGSQKKRFLDQLLKICRNFIDDEIYIPVPDDQIYERTYALLRSFVYQVFNGEYSILFGEDLDSTAGDTNKWNPTGSPLAVTGEAAGQAAYMYFFEKPDSSFIPDYRNPMRKFMAELTDIIHLSLRGHVHKATNRAIKGKYSFIKIEK